MFKITGKKGFHITFSNGYTVSVQFGPGNYCDNYNAVIGVQEETAGAKGSTTAEVAVWGKNGGMIEHPMFSIGNTVGGYFSPEQVLELLIWASSQNE